MSGSMPSRPQDLFRVIRHELRVLAADRSLWVVSAVLAALCAYALVNGLEHARARDAARAEALAEEAVASDALRASWRRVMAREEPPDVWANPTDPSLVGDGLATRYATLPTAPLAPLALGQSDMLPDTYRITTASRVEFMYDSEIENPWNLLTGRFDLAFVITYLLPLFVLGWSYNLLTSEREQGTLRLLLSQPVRLGVVIAAKVTVRAVVIGVWCVVVPLLAQLLLRQPQRDDADVALLAVAGALIAAYALFWFALAVLVDALARSSALGALVLVSSWVVLVLVFPVALSLGAALASPAPSRAELATETRIITAQTLMRLADKWGSDYRHVEDPELLLPKDGRFEVPERMQAFFLSSRELDARLERALTAFDIQLAGQQTIVDRLGVLSPAIVVHEGLAALAGNGTRRYQQFQAQVTAFHAEWRRFFEPRISEGLAITEADIAALPRFVWVEPASDALLSDTFERLLGLLAAAGLMALAARRGLGRYPVA
jgi:ABC-2 type transport system permease protein